MLASIPPWSCRRLTMSITTVVITATVVARLLFVTMEWDLPRRRRWTVLVCTNINYNINSSKRVSIIIRSISLRFSCHSRNIGNMTSRITWAIIILLTGNTNTKQNNKNNNINNKRVQPQPLWQSFTSTALVVMWSIITKRAKETNKPLMNIVTKTMKMMAGNQQLHNNKMPLPCSSRSKRTISSWSY